MAEQDYGEHDPRNHARDCTFHLDQYAFECDCGATARYEGKAEQPQGGALYVQFAESPGAHGGESIRKWSRQPFEGALKFERMTYQANPRDTDDMSPRLSGALASIIADPDCCAASKAIAREALRQGQVANSPPAKQ